MISKELVFIGNNAAGNGSIPISFNLFNFSLLICSCSDSMFVFFFKYNQSISKEGL